MNDLEMIFEIMSNQSRRARSKTGMVLSGAVAALEALGDTPVRGLGRLASYRGYYADLAFEPLDTVLPASTLLLECRAALGNVFSGYKGGDYVMGPDTPLWVASWGDTTQTRLVGFENRDGVIHPATIQDDE